MAHAVCRLRSQSTTLRSVTTRVRSTHSNEDKDAIAEYQRKSGESPYDLVDAGIGSLGKSLDELVSQFIFSVALRLIVGSIVVGPEPVLLDLSLSLERE
jgi:hypothetical protein